MVEDSGMASHQGDNRLLVLVISALTMLQGVASFHLDRLIPDLHFHDSTLVVNPCNSPEQIPTTLGSLDLLHSQRFLNADAGNV